MVKIPDIIVLTQEAIQELATNGAVSVPYIGGKTLIMSQKHYNECQKEKKK